MSRLLMHWKTWVPLVLALAFGLLAAKVGRDLMLRQRGASAGSERLTRIVIAAADIEPGHALATSDLEMGTTGAASAPRGSFAAIPDAVGRVAIAPLVRGQPILKSLLAPVGAGSGPQALVPRGMRFITVEVNEITGVGGMISPGCRVDVLTTLQDERGNHPVARMIVQDVGIVAVGPQISGNPRKSDSGAGPLRSVTLAVSPQQAEALELASSAGRIRLALRGSMDRSPSDSTGTNVAQLLGWKEPVIQVVQPVQPATRPVEPQVPPAVASKPRSKAIEVISGGQSSTVEVALPAEPGGNTAVTGTGMESRP